MTQKDGIGNKVTEISADKITCGSISADKIFTLVGGKYTWVKPVTGEASHRLTNCKNCGAVLTGRKCEYCGTEY